MIPRKHRSKFALAVSLVLGLLVIQLSAQAQASLTNIRGVQTYTGSLSDGATYLIEVPRNWNGTLLLYSQGYAALNPFPAVVTVGPGGPADPLLRFYLLTHGYALAGSSASIGYRVQEAFSEQIEVLDTFNALVGPPARTIAWGHSLGGIITAGLIQKYPDRFSAALPMCGATGGSVGFWNQWLDAAFAFKTLLAPGSGLQVVNITDADTNFSIAEQALTAAQATAEGRARIALVAALTDLSGWIDPFSPEPDPTDYETQEANQFLEFQQGFRPLCILFSGRSWKGARAAIPHGTRALITRNNWRFQLITPRSTRCTSRPAWISMPIWTL